MASELLSPMRREFSELADTLQTEAKRSPLAFLPNPGNWGAALTAEATRRFLAAHAIPFRELRSLRPRELVRGFVRRETLILSGGGAWSERYPSGRLLAARAARFFRRIVVLPSSYGMPVSLRNSSLWARDRFDSLRQASTARFCHDLGFSMERLIAPPPSAAIGKFFRGDQLSANPLHVGASDLSSRGNQYSPLEPFISTIAQYEEVHTDRVHVAIVACLLGRRCHVWPTATPLLADLFASSIAPHFPEAVFHGPLPSTGSQTNSTA